VVNTTARCTFFLLTAMDYAASSVFMLVGIFLLVAMDYAARCTFFLLTAMDYAAGSVFMLVGIFLLVDSFLLIGFVYAVKEKKKRALADLRYRALKGKPMKKYEVTQMMRNLVKNQWCAAHNDDLEKDRLLSAQYNLFQPTSAITEPPSKRQRVEHVSSQSASVPAATTLPANDPDSAGGGSSNPAGLATPM
ncbi:hypothetical protein Tco_1231688, partial [Tanacetum coccineum]